MSTESNTAANQSGSMAGSTSASQGTTASSQATGPTPLMTTWTTASSTAPTSTVMAGSTMSGSTQGDIPPFPPVGSAFQTRSSGRASAVDPRRLAGEDEWFSTAPSWPSGRQQQQSNGAGRRISVEEAVQMLGQQGFELETPIGTPIQDRAVNTGPPPAQTTPSASVFQQTQGGSAPGASRVAPTSMGSAGSSLLELLVQGAPESMATAVRQPEVATKMLENLYAALSGKKQTSQVELTLEKSPFTKEIVAQKPTEVIVTPLSLNTYDGTTNPDDFLVDFNYHRMANQWSTITSCFVFPGCLRGTANSWFKSLPEGSITGFDDLRTKFLAKFAVLRVQELTYMDLHYFPQMDRETLNQFIDRFTIASSQVPNVSEIQMVGCFTQSLCTNRFLPLVQRLKRHVPDTYAEAIKMVRTYIREQNLGAIGAPQKGKDSDGGNNGNGGGSGGGQGHQGYGGNSGGKKKNGGGGFGKGQTGHDNGRSSGYHPYDRPSSRRLTPEEDEIIHSLTKTPKTIFMTEEICKTFADPAPLPKKQIKDNGTYCLFHEEKGHDTDNCRSLKRVILEKLEAGEFKHLKPHPNAKTAATPKKYSWKQGEKKVD